MGRRPGIPAGQGGYFASHPFFTGKQKFVDTAGRVERFQRKFQGDYFQKGKAAEAKAAGPKAAEPKAEQPKA